MVLNYFIIFKYNIDLPIRLTKHHIGCIIDIEEGETQRETQRERPRERVREIELEREPERDPERRR